MNGIPYIWEQYLKRTRKPSFRFTFRNNFALIDIFDVVSQEILAEATSIAEIGL